MFYTLLQLSTTYKQRRAAGEIKQKLERSVRWKHSWTDRRQQKGGGKKKERGKKEQKEKREIRIKGDSASVKENREGNKKVGKEERKIYINRARSKGANKVLQSTQIYRLRNQWQNQFGWTWLLALGNASDQIL